MVSNAVSANSVTDVSVAAAPSKTLVHTPFGDVTVDENSKPDFYALFHPMAAAPSQTEQAPAESSRSTAEATSPAPHAPTAESVFGPSPWMASPAGTGPGETKWSYNPIYFATQATAEKVASMVGGHVIERNDITDGGPFHQTVPNEMVQFADGRILNAGLIANLFNHGYSQSYIDAQLKALTDGGQA